ncbi:MAG: hypothetical protein ACFFFD_05970 [Promethearchaeota archaeon]
MASTVAEPPKCVSRNPTDISVTFDCAETMDDLELVKSLYLKLRESLIAYLGKFDDGSYFYQPTPKSNATAWIVPHISAFEKLMVTDKIPGFDFPQFITAENVAIYRPGVKAYALARDEMMQISEAIELLKLTQKVSIGFLDDMIAGRNSVREVDHAVVVDKYLLNFSHETEHYGQLKYLLGTWKRMNS